jgi:holliday junction DNA helicase RuvA
VIAQLCGTLVDIRPPILVLLVHGVGYEIECPLPLFSKLPDDQSALTLYTHLVVKEDAHALFGFQACIERDLFRELIKASGVGPKLALNILSHVTLNELFQCIHTKDTAVLKRIKGIGAKMAEKLIVDLHGRIDSWSLTSQDYRHTGPTPTTRHLAFDDTVAALIQLGYRPQQATHAARKACEQAPDASADMTIRFALKQIQTNQQAG